MEGSGIDTEEALASEIFLVVKTRLGGAHADQVAQYLRSAGVHTSQAGSLPSAASSLGPWRPEPPRGKTSL